MVHIRYSKFDQNYKLTMYDFDHHTVFNPYLELDFQMDVGKCAFSSGSRLVKPFLKSQKNFIMEKLPVLEEF